MALPKNGVAKEIRSYVGSLFVFLFVIGIIITLLQFPVLESKLKLLGLVRAFRLLMQYFKEHFGDD